MRNEANGAAHNQRGAIVEWKGGLLLSPPWNETGRRHGKVGVALGAQTGLFPAGLLELPTYRRAEHARQRGSGSVRVFNLIM